MFLRYLFGITVLLAAPLPSAAQCFRDACGDKAALQIRSQLSVTVPGGASASDEVKAMENTRHELYALSNRECDSLRAIFGGDCSLSNITMNSQTQDRGNQGRSAFVSINSTYEIKRAAK